MRVLCLGPAIDHVVDQHHDLVVKGAGVISSFEAAQDNAPHKVALADNKQHNHGYTGHESTGHQGAPIGVVQTLKARQADRQGHLGLVVQVDQWAEEIVPGADEREDRQRDQRRLGQRQPDAGVDAVRRATVVA
jgi:hypothetical protein